MQAIRHDDLRLSWEGAVSVERTSEWSQPWRVPFEERGLYPAQMMRRLNVGAGVRLTFRSDTTALAGRVAPEADMEPVDLYVDGALHESLPMAGRGEFAFRPMPAGKKLVELWLPHWMPFKLRGLEMDDGAQLLPAEDTRPRWVTYGSSITQCQAAQSPSFTWPAIVARECNLHLTCLGFSGQCLADPMIARLIRDLPADYISLCLGANIFNQSAMKERVFGPAVIGYVKIIREKHPDVPLVVLSPVLLPRGEGTTNKADLTLTRMREIVGESVTALQAHGDRNVHYVNGLEVFGPGMEIHMPDKLHPTAEGYKIFGRNFIDRVARRYFADVPRRG